MIGATVYLSLSLSVGLLSFCFCIGMYSIYVHSTCTPRMDDEWKKECAKTEKRFPVSAAIDRVS